MSDHFIKDFPQILNKMYISIEKTMATVWNHSYNTVALCFLTWVSYESQHSQPPS